jgi:hypothetical protein
MTRPHPDAFSLSSFREGQLGWKNAGSLDRTEWKFNLEKHREIIVHHHFMLGFWGWPIFYELKLGFGSLEWRN